MNKYQIMDMNQLKEVYYTNKRKLKEYKYKLNCLPISLGTIHQIEKYLRHIQACNKSLRAIKYEIGERYFCQ